MKCEYCGSNMDQSDKSCPNCGTVNKAYGEIPVIKEEIPKKEVANIKQKKEGKARRVSLTISTVLAYIFLIVGAVIVSFCFKLFPSMQNNDLTKLVLFFVVALFGIFGGGASVVSGIFSIVGISLAAASFKNNQKPIIRLILCIFSLLGAIGALGAFVYGLLSI